LDRFEDTFGRVRVLGGGHGFETYFSKGLIGLKGLGLRIRLKWV
jgi:hypothetical protein